MYVTLARRGIERMFIRSAPTHTVAHFILAAMAIVIAKPCETHAQANYEMACRYVNDYPSYGTPSWGDNDNLTNGVAHDDANWYFSAIDADWATGSGDGHWTLWRIPVDEPLDQDLGSNRRVLVRHRSEVVVIHQLGYNHIGDIDCYRFGNTDYLVAPLTGGGSPIIAFFRADDLQFLTYMAIPGQPDVGWCAIHPQSGDLVTSADDATTFRRFRVDWEHICQGCAPESLELVGSQPFVGITNAPYTLHDMQGGEFSPSGELLFVVCGVFASQNSTDGVHIFSTSASPWKLVQRSFNSGTYYSISPPHFIYQFDNSWDGGEEPEGLTYWDLGGGEAPLVQGELHVILYDHNYLGTNETSLKHYSRRVYVDYAAPAPDPNGQIFPYPPLPGDESEPFDTLENAVGWYNPMWDGGEVTLKAGSYDEQIVLDKKLRISSRGGAATVGQ